MAIFWRLFLAHLIADFTLQLDVVNKLKRQHIGGMMLHCLTHLVTAAALTWPYLGETWFSVGAVRVGGWAALGVMLVVHFMVDELRIYGMKKTRFSDGTLSFLADQALHVYVLFMISPVSMPDGGIYLPEKWTVLLSIFVLVTHVTTILVYFLEKDLFGKEFPGFDEKYFLIFERVVLWAFFFSAGWWWVFFAGAWTAQILYIKHKRILDLSLANIVLSVVLTSGLGLWSRHIYFGSL